MIDASRVLRLGVGFACIAVLLVIYVLSAPPLLFYWQAGPTIPPPASGWYWPQWLSALLVSVACGLMFATATRLGALPLWAASATLGCGLGWMVWMVALIPSAKSGSLLLVSAGLATLVWWSAGDRVATLTLRSYFWFIVAIVLFIGGAWMQSLLPPGDAVRMSASAPDILRALAGEIRPVAIVIAAVGLAELWSRTRRAAAALGGVLAAYFLLPALFGVSPDAAILPASLPLWVAVAFGLEWIARAGPRRTSLALAFVVAVLIPGERWLLNHTFTQRAAAFFPGSLALSLAAIPSHGTLVSDGPGTDRRIGRAAAVLPVGPFRVVSAETLASRQEISDAFAFRALPDEARAGRAFQTVPRHAPLSAFLRMLPPDNIVAIALTPVAARALSRARPGYFAGIGAPAAANAAAALAIVGRAHAASGAIVQQDRDLARIAVAEGTPWGEPAGPSPIAIEAVADRNFAAVSVAGRELVRVLHGGVLVVTSREGLLRMASAITAEQQLLVPLPTDEWALGQLVRASGSGPASADPFFAHPLDASALVRFDGGDAAYFSSGWHLPERDGPIDYTWMSETKSHLQIPLVEPLELRVFVELRPAFVDDRDPPMVALHVNGVAFEQQPPSPERRMYEWRVPADAWRPGVNDVAIELTKLTRPLGSHDQRLLGAAVSLFRLERARR